MGLLFGTDGVRGVANTELSPELAFKLGRAGAYILTEETGLRSIVIGRDTRLSGDMLEAALVAGICSVGVNVLRVGVMPTPAVAYLTRALEAGGGVVISASHNPFADNGIKFFGANGYKLSDELESRIEEMVLDPGAVFPLPTGAELGRVRDVADARERYIRYVSTTGPGSLSGIKVVLDCANGSACTVAPQLFAGLGATVVPVHNSPDGTNINVNCGSTKPNTLREAVLAERADLGLAYDGDADRLIAVDEKGGVVDGDFIMVACALYLQERGALKDQTLITTVMSNMGLHLALREAGINILITKVGDRYVLEEMLRCNASLGGEQSGHIIFGDYATTGDGIITSLQLLKVMLDTGKPLSALAAQMERLPQVLRNVRVKNKERVMESPLLASAITGHEYGLNGQGRILVRPSGTEPLVRVMVEGKDEGLMMRVVEDLVNLVSRIDSE
ncbi:MAG: phosphoglucosamine mutase [Desulforudis sp.]|nr:MAG: phosphoglucosamine mutase [Desulforudis sp.]